MTEEEEYQRIVDNPPETRRDFIVRKIEDVYSTDGHKYTQTTSMTMSGMPELMTLEDDLHDSRWNYPVLATRIIGTVLNKVPTDHATYWSAKRVKK